jgi:hypothetical protein
MPTFNFVFWKEESGGFLETDGPVIDVEISMPKQLEAWCVKNNLPVPAPVTGYALIDTGASISGIHLPILEQLSLLPIDFITLQGATGIDDKAPVYPARVSFPGINLNDVPMSRVVGNQVRYQTPSGKNVIMLLGRDLLKHFNLIYNGTFNQIILSY